VSERILVCDDDPQIMRALRIMLTAAGYEVTSASNAEDALDAAAVRAPDLAILDLLLPDHDGIWICERLREWTKIPILMLSAIGDESEMVRALEAGADDYVTKPFGNEELLARLRANLRRATGEAGDSVITVEQLEIDLAGRTVRREGELVHLTATEFRLLRALAQARGKLLTHRQILTDVWGIEYADDVHVLRVHTANLRRKIETESARPTIILTDPGVGYRFAA
jgi:two-component system KDP operon response regulator KdpE